MSLDELDRVVRERLIGSPPHTLQHLGTVEKINYIGTIGRIRSQGTIATLGTVLLTVHVGTIGKINRLGTQKWLGTVQRLSYVARTGSLGYLSRLGTIARREQVSETEWGGLHISRGSIYVGSARRVDGYNVKTLSLRSTFPGTLEIISSLRGTGIDSGTYYRSRVGAGSYNTFSWTEALYQEKTRFVASGSSNTGKGTLYSFLAKQS